MAQPGVILEYYRPFATAVNDVSHMLSGATTVVVDDASGFVVNSIIFIEAEQIKITAISSNTLTVLRAQNGTSAVQHNNDILIDVGWIKAVTHADNSAILNCDISKQLDAPATAELILSNRSKDPSSTDTAKSTGALSDPSGERSTIFTEFQDIRIIETETGLALFRGRIYSVRGQYDLQYGNTVKIVAKDMLQELADIPIDNETPALKSIDVSSASYDRRSKVAAFVIGKISTNFLTTDTDKYETSAAAFTAKEKQTSQQKVNGDYVWDVSSNAQQALELINLFAKTDPHDSNEESAHFGYDYYVDANLGSSALTHNSDSGKVAMHWYKRGSRPHATDIPKYGFTLEYPSKGWGGQTHFRKQMLADSEFTNPNGAFFTSVVAHFEDTGDDDDDIANRTIHGIANFELVKGTIEGDFPWESKRLQYIDDGVPIAGASRIFTATNTGVTPKQFNGQSTNTTNPRFLFVESDYATATSTSHVLPCATVHFQSETDGGANNYLILSNVYKDDTTYIDPQGNSVNFRAFPVQPSGAAYVRLHVAKSLGHSDTSTGIYFDILNGARATEKHDIHKPQRIQIRSGTLESYDSIRTDIAGTLDRGSKDTVTIAKVRASRYPYVKGIARTTGFSNTRSTNVITFATNTFLAGDGSTQFTDPRTFGAKKGVVVAQLAKTNGSNSKVVRYAYISAINATTVTYGTSQTDTSDGTALDVAYDLAILVPVEAGHKVRVKNKMYGVDYDILVTKLDFSSSPGTLTTQIEGAGVNGPNHNAEGVATVPAYTVTYPKGGYLGGGSGGVDVANLSAVVPPSNQNVVVGNGTISAYDGNHVQILTNPTTYITLTTQADGRVYQVDKADQTTVNGYTYNRLEIGATSGDFGHAHCEDEVHVLFFRTKGVAYKSRQLQACAVRRTVTSNIGGKIYSEIATPDDIIVGTAQKDSTAHPSGGMCVVEIGASGAFGSGWPMDVTSIGKHRLTSVLSKKGMLGWTTNTVFSATGTSGEYNKIRFGIKGTIANNSAVSFSDEETAEVVLSSANVTWGDGNSSSESDGKITLTAGSNYFYKLVGDSASTTIAVTATYTDASKDDRILMALVSVVASDDGSDSPSIFPFNGNEATISAGVISAGAIVAGNIQTGSLDSHVITLTGAGVIKSRVGGVTKAYGDNNAGFFLGGSSSQFQIGPNNGDNLKWTGSALGITGKISGATEITIGGTDSTAQESTEDGPGKITLNDRDGAGRMRIRAFQDYLQFDTLACPMYISLTGGGSDVVVDGTTWAQPENFLAPTVAASYLGDIRDTGGNFTFGRGWKALVLHSILENTVAEQAGGGTLVLRAHDTTDDQYVFTFPQNPGTNGYALTTNGYGDTSWTAASGSGTVTSVAASASATNGLSLSGGTITSTGTIAIQGTLTINNGDWVGTDLAVTHGGTGTSSLTAGYVLLGSDTGAITTLNVTAKGSILVGDGSGDPRALAVGTNNHVLTADSTQATGLKWAAGAAGGDTTYATSFVDSGSNVLLRLTAGGSGSGTQDLQFVAGTGISLTPSGSDTTIAMLIDDAPVDGVTTEAISSNWAYDHNADASAHISSGTATFNGPWRMTNDPETGSATAIGLDGGSPRVLKLITSSRRFKKNERTLEVDSSLIYNLTAVTYDERQNESNTGMFGWIAEDVDLIIPRMVTRSAGPDGEQRPEGINYGLAAVLLVEEIKKLKARIEVLEGG